MKLKILLSFLIIFKFSSSYAGKVLFSPLVLEARYEQNEYRNLENKRPRGFTIGYKSAGYHLDFEYSTFEVDSGNDFLGIQRNHQDYLVWLKKNVFNYQHINISFGLAGGVYKESITSYLGSEINHDQGISTAMLGAGLGANYTIQKIIFLEAELRAFDSQNISPSPQLSAAMRVGLLF